LNVKEEILVKEFKYIYLVIIKKSTSILSLFSNLLLYETRKHEKINP